jgi:hypothetical protein
MRVLLAVAAQLLPAARARTSLCCARAALDEKVKTNNFLWNNVGVSLEAATANALAGDEGGMAAAVGAAHAARERFSQHTAPQRSQATPPSGGKGGNSNDDSEAEPAYAPRVRRASESKPHAAPKAAGGKRAVPPTLPSTVADELCQVRGLLTHRYDMLIAGNVNPRGMQNTHAGG